MVISNSTRSGGVTEEPWDVFANGQSVMENENPSPAVGLMRVLRARSKVGTDYSLFDWNCEHLVTYAQGKPIKSNQIEIMTAVLLLGGAIWLARSKR